MGRKFTGLAPTAKERTRTNDEGRAMKSYRQFETTAAVVPGLYVSLSRKWSSGSVPIKPTPFARQRGPRRLSAPLVHPIRLIARENQCKCSNSKVSVHMGRQECFYVLFPACRHRCRTAGRQRGFGLNDRTCARSTDAPYLLFPPSPSMETASRSNLSALAFHATEGAATPPAVVSTFKSNTC